MLISRCFMGKGIQQSLTPSCRAALLVHCPSYTHSPVLPSCRPTLCATLSRAHPTILRASHSHVPLYALLSQALLPRALLTVRHTPAHIPKGTTPICHSLL
eukprot:Phypoly_transcript_21016.p3 GENE.Phypoly_transcript_21016~~Phypoly_transcript_21016.p3  ORF type:complete len:101 (+),score=11.17 Phypoly_transcript_21016:79-381(+)